ncbi:MAG: flagellar hook-length control protein FliK [Syntrophomonadaceae bacterium]
MNMPVMATMSTQESLTPVLKKHLLQESNNISFFNKFEQISGKQEKQDIVNSNSISTSLEAVDLNSKLIFPAEEVHTDLEGAEIVETIPNENLIEGMLNPSKTAVLKLEEVLILQLKTLLKNESPQLVNTKALTPELITWSGYGSGLGQLVSTNGEQLARTENIGMALPKAMVSGTGESMLSAAFQALTSEIITAQQAGSGTTMAAANQKQSLGIALNVAFDQPAKVGNTDIEPQIVSRNELVKVAATTGEEVEMGVKTAAITCGADKILRETAVLKQWMQNLLILNGTRGYTKTLSETGAEMSNSVDIDVANVDKTASATDVKKLIDFENLRLNTSRLSLESLNADSMFKTTIDDGKVNMSMLSTGAADLFKTNSNVIATADCKNYPDAQEIMDQIMQKAELLLNRKLSEFRIELKPEFLGKLTIKVMVEEGVVTARFIAESQQVKQLLETNLPVLKQNLESQGLRVDRVEVNVALPNGGMYDGSGDSRQYLWQNEQYSERQHRGYSEELFEDIYLEETDSDEAPAFEQGFNENGTMNFLV